MLFMSCVFVMLLRLTIANFWSFAGEGLTSWLRFVTFKCVFVTFPCGILGQVWYLIVSILDLCRLSYFYFYENSDTQFEKIKTSQRAITLGKNSVLSFRQYTHPPLILKAVMRFLEITPVVTETERGY